jgi:hypothetical protein
MNISNLAEILVMWMLYKLHAPFVDVIYTTAAIVKGFWILGVYERIMKT